MQRLPPLFLPAVLALAYVSVIAATNDEVKNENGLVAYPGPSIRSLRRFTRASCRTFLQT